MATLEIGSWMYGGFCSNINTILAYLYNNRHISSIKWNIKSGQSGPLAYIAEGTELFGLLFEEDGQEEVVYNYDNKAWENCDISLGNAIRIYHDSELRSEYSKIYHRFFRPKKALLNGLFDTLIGHQFSSDRKYVSILIRSDCLGSEQPNGIMPTIEDYVRFTQDVENATYILSVDNHADLEICKKIFKPFVYNPRIRRSPDRSTEPHTSKIGTLCDLYDTFLEVYLLAKGDYIVHPISNMSTTSLLINPNQESRFINATS